MRAIISGRSRAIGHLHGIWTAPQSVILSNDDYSRLRMDEAAQAIQEAFAITSRIVYLGFGSGLSDPNFSQLLKRQRELFPNSQISHIRLCKRAEEEELRRIHFEDNIETLVYGDEYSDLPAFLRSAVEELETGSPEMSESRILLNPMTSARELFLEEMKEEILLNDVVKDAETRILDDLAVEPVLLPVPQSEYVAANLKANSKKIKRIDPKSDIVVGSVIILVGDEHSGLTFSAKWIAAQAALSLNGVTPLYINYPQLRGKSNDVLENACGASLRRMGITTNSPELPPLSLVIDDLNPFSPLANRVFSGISRLEETVCVITCRQGAEEEIRAQLEKRGVETSVRYQGRLERRDVEFLARVVEPDEYSNLANDIVKLLVSEHLPRTPYTVCQLIFILLRNGRVSGGATSATIMDEYVAMLLGRGDVSDDARYGTDSEQRAAILEHLAEALVMQNDAGLRESDAIGKIANILELLGWEESPVDLLTDFMKRRALKRDGGFVVFARSSYLHLFAAKRASKSPDFRDVLLRDPLYYSAAIASYASLQRHDAAPLVKMEELVSGLEETGPKAELYLSKELIQPSFRFNEDAEDGDDNRELAPADDFVDMLSMREDDPPAFPVVREVDMPPTFKRMRILELSSVVVRDADQAGDLATKQRMVEKLLHHWALVAEFLNVDEEFQRIFAEIGEKLEKSNDSVNEEPDPKFGEIKKDVIDLDQLGKLVAAAISFGGVAGTLASRRLLRSVRRIAESAPDGITPQTAIAATFFLATLREKGWEEQVDSLLVPFGDRWISQDFILYYLLGMYLDPSLPDSAELLEVCIKVIQKGTSYRSTRERSAHAVKVRQVMSKARLREVTKFKRPVPALDEGPTE